MSAAQLPCRLGCERGVLYLHPPVFCAGACTHEVVAERCPACEGTGSTSVDCGDCGGDADAELVRVIDGRVVREYLCFACIRRLAAKQEAAREAAELEEESADVA